MMPTDAPRIRLFVQCERAPKLVLFLLLFIPGSAFAQAPVTYRVSFPAPQHHYADVEIVFADCRPGRSSSA